MVGESLSERHIADRQRKHAQRAMHAGEMSSFKDAQVFVFHNVATSVDRGICMKKHVVFVL